MKIIRDGILMSSTSNGRISINDHVFNNVCNTCGCIFEYDWLDINKTTEIVESTCYSPTVTMHGEIVAKEIKNIYTYEITSIHCPCCKKYLVIKKELLSS